MIRYFLAAQALKVFSLTPPSRRLYRRLGNRIGGRSRASSIQPHYIQRAHHNLRFVESAGGIANGMKLLELGTGWVHWESLFTRLFYDVEIMLFDVVDNRQFGGFLTHCRSLRSQLHEVKRPQEELARAATLLDRLLQLDSFDAVYDLLGFRYLLDESGSLRAVSDESIDLVFSSDVLEHVPRGSVTDLIKDLRRVIRPSGITAHQIVPADHLCIYDKSTHSKNYIRYSDFAWRALFQNDVQYFNRIQHSEWLTYFAAGGFETVAEEIVSRADISDVKIAKRFADYSQDDLEATVTRVALRRSDGAEG